LARILNAAAGILKDPPTPTVYEQSEYAWTPPEKRGVVALPESTFEAVGSESGGGVNERGRSAERQGPGGPCRGLCESTPAGVALHRRGRRVKIAGSVPTAGSGRK